MNQDMWWTIYGIGAGPFFVAFVAAALFLWYRSDEGSDSELEPEGWFWGTLGALTVTMFWLPLVIIAAGVGAVAGVVWSINRAVQPRAARDRQDITRLEQAAGVEPLTGTVMEPMNPDKRMMLLEAAAEAERHGEWRLARGFLKEARRHG